MVSMVTQSTDINTGEFVVGLTGHCAIFPPPPVTIDSLMSMTERVGGVKDLLTFLT